MCSQSGGDTIVAASIDEDAVDGRKLVSVQTPGHLCPIRPYLE